MTHSIQNGISRTRPDHQREVKVMSPTVWIHSSVARIWSGILVTDGAVPYFVCGALGVLPLVFLTPPFQVPDEQYHFYRAYQISELSLRGEVRDNLAGAFL